MWLLIFGFRLSMHIASILLFVFEDSWYNIKIPRDLDASLFTSCITNIFLIFIPNIFKRLTPFGNLQMLTITSVYSHQEQTRWTIVLISDFHFLLRVGLKYSINLIYIRLSSCTFAFFSRIFYRLNGKLSNINFSSYFSSILHNFPNIFHLSYTFLQHSQ